MQILSKEIWDGAWNSALLTSSQVMCKVWSTDRTWGRKPRWCYLTWCPLSTCGCRATETRSVQTEMELERKAGTDSESFDSKKKKLKWPLTTTTTKSLQSCPTLCDPMDGSPPGFPIPGILQARTLEWGAIAFSNAWKWKGKVKSLSRVRLLATPWTAAHQAPPSMGFSRQEYWSGVPLPSPKWPLSNVFIMCLLKW